MKILKSFKVEHKSFGDIIRECDSCSYTFKHKLLFYPFFKTYEHTGECPQCGTESIHDVEEWEVEEYECDAVMGQAWLIIETQEMNKCDE